MGKSGKGGVIKSGGQGGGTGTRGQQLSKLRRFNIFAF